MIQAGPGKRVAEPYACFEYYVYVEYHILGDMIFNCLDYSFAEP